MLYNTLVVTCEDLSYIAIIYYIVGNHLTYIITMKKITKYVLIVFTYLYIDNIIDERRYIISPYDNR